MNGTPADLAMAKRRQGGARGDVVETKRRVNPTGRFLTNRACRVDALVARVATARV
jgi:hypothetical protein